MGAWGLKMKWEWHTWPLPLLPLNNTQKHEKHQPLLTRSATPRFNDWEKWMNAIGQNDAACHATWHCPRHDGWLPLMATHA